MAVRYILSGLRETVKKEGGNLTEYLVGEGEKNGENALPDRLVAILERRNLSIAFWLDIDE